MQRNMSSELTGCLSIAELAQHVVRPERAVAAHIEGCRRCRAIVRLLRERDREAAPEIAQRELPAAPLPRREEPSKRCFGEVCIAESEQTDGRLLVCVALSWDEETEPKTAVMAPVSPEIENASDSDLILGADEPLGYAAIVEVWNHGTVLGDQIVERLGVLGEETRRSLDAVYEAVLGGESSPAGVQVGVEIVSDDDPRAMFQEEESERARPFWQPAARLYAERPAEEPSLGTVLREWLGEKGYDERDYATELGWRPSEVAAVCNDAFDPLRITAEHVAEAAASIDADSDDLGIALMRTLRPEQFAGAGEPIQRERVFARTAGRRRRGRATQARQAVKPASRQQQEALLKKYVQDFVAAVEEWRGG
jgi:hypothetical protein